MTTESKVWVAVSVVIMWTAVSAVAWPGLARQLRLRDRAAVGVGEVVKIDPGDHNRATYRYTVGDRVFEGSEVASHRRRGDKVRVYYDPGEPSVAMLIDPRTSLTSDIVGLLMLYAFFAVAAVSFGRRASANRAR
jgi:hypothetical protein